MRLTNSRSLQSRRRTRTLPDRLSDWRDRGGGRCEFYEAEAARFQAGVREVDRSAEMGVLRQPVLLDLVRGPGFTRHEPPRVDVLLGGVSTANDDSWDRTVAGAASSIG
jgi:hypothetical protein